MNKKYGFRDWRGGGRSSARETIGRVAAGAIAKKILRMNGIEVLVMWLNLEEFVQRKPMLKHIRTNTEKKSREVRGSLKQLCKWKQ